MNDRSIVRLLTCLLIVATAFQTVFAQRRSVISVGFGMPELINIGYKYRISQFQLGLRAGTVPLQDESIISVCADAFLHFGGHSGLNDLHPWFIRTGLGYLRDETAAVLEKNLFLNLGIGRDINFTDRFGLVLDAGLLIRLYHHRERKEPSGGWFDLDLNVPVLPGAGFGFFYRL